MIEFPATMLTDGSPVPADGSHTALKPNGQQEGYVVLSEAERAKGFVRPVRTSYMHVGPPRPAELRDLTPEEHERYGRGCGTVTTMGIALAETYARDPSFYGGTFCCGCGKHFPVGEVGEFVWRGTNERVGT